MNTEVFAQRHIGIRPDDLTEMLEVVKAENLQELIFETIPDDILLKKPLDLPPAMSEQEFLVHLEELADKTKVF